MHLVIVVSLCSISSTGSMKKICTPTVNLEHIDHVKGDFSVFLKKNILWMKTIHYPNTLYCIVLYYDVLYCVMMYCIVLIKILLGHNRTNGAVYSKIYFKVEIYSAL